MIGDFAAGLAQYAVLASGVAGPIAVRVKYGEIVQLINRSSWKLAVVLGPSRVPGKTRVCAWIAASRRFGVAAMAVPSSHIAAIVDASRYTARQRAVLKAAEAASKVLRR